MVEVVVEAVGILSDLGGGLFLEDDGANRSSGSVLKFTEIRSNKRI